MITLKNPFAELIKKIKTLTIEAQVLELLGEFLPTIIEKSGVRDQDQIFTFLIESSYEVLPLPIRMFIKKDVYVKAIEDQKEKAIQLISKKLGTN